MASFQCFLFIIHTTLWFWGVRGYSGLSDYLKSYRVFHTSEAISQTLKSGGISYQSLTKIYIIYLYTYIINMYIYF